MLDAILYFFHISLTTFLSVVVIREESLFVARDKEKKKKRKKIMQQNLVRPYTYKSAVYRHTATIYARGFYHICLNAESRANDEISVGYCARDSIPFGMIDFSQLGELLRWSLNNDYYMLFTSIGHDVRR